MITHSLFQRPHVYDWAFTYDLGAQNACYAKLLGALGSEDQILVPACGTGRFAHPLAGLGYQVRAFDIQPEMLMYAQATRAHERLHYFSDDMSQMVEATRFAPYCAGLLANNSFRYLLTRDHAANHLFQMRQLLIQGGHYIIELGLSGQNPEVEMNRPIEWTVENSTRKVFARWTLDALEGDLGRDRIEIEVFQDGQCERFIDFQYQLLWNLEGFEALVYQNGFSISGVYSQTGVPLDIGSLTMNRGKYIFKLEARR